MRHVVAVTVLATFGTVGAGAQAGKVTSKPSIPAAPSDAEVEKEPVPIIVNTTLDRTAAWIGDPIDYSIEIICPPGSDILAADISVDRLKLTGLEVASSMQQRDARSDGTMVYRARFRLVSFVTDGSTVGIEPQPIRYYVHTAGQPTETLVPADEVQLPARQLVIRSTLPEQVEWIRDARNVGTLPSFARYLTPIGIAVVALSVVPVIVGFAGLASRWAPRRTGQARRQSLQSQRRALQDIRRLDVSTDLHLRRDVFRRLNALIRDRLTDFDIPARSLTADEIEPLIGSQRKRLAPGSIAVVLRSCEHAMYGPDALLPEPEALLPVLAETERLLSNPRR